MNIFIYHFCECKFSLATPQPNVGNVLLEWNNEYSLWLSNSLSFDLRDTLAGAQCESSSKFIPAVLEQIRPVTNVNTGINAPQYILTLQGL